MKRKDVYALIDKEREYQDTTRKLNKGETRDDSEKSVCDFIIYMEYQLNKAKWEIYHYRESGALEAIRKVTALGVAVMEQNDTKPRA